jgi:ABC-type multidrug transport system fused ATPase/permease subunit
MAYLESEKSSEKKRFKESSKPVIVLDGATFSWSRYGEPDILIYGVGEVIGKEEDDNSEKRKRKSCRKKDFGFVSPMIKAILELPISLEEKAVLIRRSVKEKKIKRKEALDFFSNSNSLSLALPKYSSFPPIPVLRDICFSLSFGSTTIIMGPVGSGKSSILFV